MARTRPQTAAHSVRGFMLNLPPLTERHVNVPGMYVCATTEERDKPWRSFSLFEGTSIDGSYELRESYQTRAICGTVVGWTAKVVDHRVLDYANTLTVEMYHPNDTLESVTEQEMLHGRNRFSVGQEIIGAANATLISTDAYTGLRRYELTTLLRGLQGTYLDASMVHNVNEVVVKVDADGVYFYPYATSKIGDLGYFKFVGGGGAVSNASCVPAVHGSKTMLPYPPVGIVGRRNGGNDLIITWEAAARTPIQALDHRTPIDAELERYKVSVMNGPNANVALRATIVTAKTWTYTSTAQILDGFTPGDPITLILSQLGSVLADGIETKVTL